MIPHNWIPSTLGHGEAMCSRCRMTNREAMALGEYDAACMVVIPRGMPNHPAAPLKGARYGAHWIGVPQNTLRLATIHANLR